ncbi:hypothetical protein TcCL_NonESM01757 [Trypanosoma cruzi]|nr:hypothetical protein TcCL_NonESM01757 [Trypanosoma cruzi]
MEDSGVIAQWTNNRSHSGGRKELSGRGFTTHAGGSSSMNTKSGASIDSRRQRSLSSSGPKRGSSPTQQQGKGKKAEKLPPIASKHQGRNNTSKGAAGAASGGSPTLKKNGRRRDREPPRRGEAPGENERAPPHPHRNWAAEPRLLASPRPLWAQVGTGNCLELRRVSLARMGVRVHRRRDDVNLSRKEGAAVVPEAKKD